MSGRGSAASIFAAACWWCSVVSAGAESPGARVLLFSGTDLWRHGNFLYGGVLWSPGGLHREGFTLKALVSGGPYSYLSDTLGEVRGREIVAQFMPGWIFKGSIFELKVFVGLDAQYHRLTPDDPGAKLRGGDIGLRAAFEFWAEPTAGTMINLTGSASTVARSYDIYAATGWRLLGLFYSGPEAQLSASEGYMQHRIGAHITALNFRGVEYSAGTGYARDSDDRDSAYFRFGAARRF
jgi:hypothetical protein